MIVQCMHSPYFAYPFICGWTLGCFYCQAIVTQAAMHRGVQVSAWAPAFASLGYTPRSRLPGSYGNAVFNCLRNAFAIFSCQMNYLGIESAYLLWECPLLISLNSSVLFLLHLLIFMERLLIVIRLLDRAHSREQDAALVLLEHAF